MRRSPGLTNLVALLAAALLASGCQTGVLPPAPGTTPPPDSTGGTAGSGNPTPTLNVGAFEQLTLERINRARLLPAQEAARNSIAIDEGIPGQIDAHSRPAVSFNGAIALAARRHADDMLANDFFAHENLLGEGPFDRIAKAGYSFSAAGENLAWRGTTGAVDELATVEMMHVDLFVDAGVDGRGHRKVMLGEHFREVGISVRRGQFTTRDSAIPTTYDAMMLVQDYATAQNAATFFVLGVVYDDRNNNGHYDFGEGTSNSTVSLGDRTATTGDAGGYRFEVPPGNYTIVFATGRSRAFAVLDKNVKIDLAGGTRIDVNLGLGEF